MSKLFYDDGETPLASFPAVPLLAAVFPLRGERVLFLVARARVRLELPFLGPRQRPRRLLTLLSLRGAPRGRRRRPRLLLVSLVQLIRFRQFVVVVVVVVPGLLPPLRLAGDRRGRRRHRVLAGGRQTR